jgi:hypothetical protein
MVAPPVFSAPKRTSSRRTRRHHCVQQAHEGGAREVGNVSVVQESVLARARLGAQPHRHMTKKPQFDLKRPLSWTAISMFDEENRYCDREAWYRKYVLGEQQGATAEMDFGKMIAESFETGKPLAPVVRYSTMEYKLSGIFGKIPLIGYIDTFDHIGKDKMREYKTGVAKWDQERADKHGQIDMYLFMLYLLHGVKPEDVLVHLDWIPTKRSENGDFKVKVEFVKPIKVHSFETRRTTIDVLNFGAKIKQIYADMQDYAKHHD